ncbi:Set7, ribosomal lysine methyltransferase, partial [Cryphonectria parasitica EP155]
HEELLAWAEGLGVEINNIRPMRLSGRGFGIVATDHIPEGTEILTVPCSILRTLDTVPSTITKKLPKDMTVHGLLAADLALNQTENATTYAKWDAVVPTWENIQLSMPMVWPASLQAFLPAAAAKLLRKQKKKFERDWDLVSAAFPFSTRGGVRASCTEEEYLYAWMLVNTRTFYFVTPRTKKLPKADHMVLQPVADLFNHTDKDGCEVAFNHATTYSFRTTRSYEKGQEVHISYGKHPNDFLLVEYGFVLDQNRWDEVCLDDAILPSLSDAQKEDLEAVGFLGKYVLDEDTACHRTQVALRLMLAGMHHGLSTKEWQRFVNGLDDGEKSQRRADGVLVSLLKDYDSEVSDQMKQLKALQFEAGSADLNQSRREMLLKRWEQIHNL